MGMGGNPFPAATGGVSSFLSGRSNNNVYVSLEYRTDDIYRETRLDGSETMLRGDYRRLSLSVPLSDSLLSAKLGVSITSSGSSALIDESPSEQAGYTGEHNTVSVSYEMRPFPSMHLQAAFGRRYDAMRFPGNYEGTISFFIPGGITVRGKLGSWDYSEALQIGITDVQGILPLDYVRRGWEISADLPLENLQLAGFVREDFFSSGANPSRDYDTRFVPDGTGLGIGVRGAAAIGGNRRVLLSVNGERIDGSGVFYSAGQKYGEIDKFELLNLSLIGGFEQTFDSGGLLEADLTWRQIGGSLEGEAENWPFVSILVSPIPVRENVNLNGSISFCQLHAGGDIPVAKFLRLSLGASAIRLFPKVTMDSWESKYLVFGVRGYKARSLNTRFVDAAIVSAGGQVSLLSFVLNYSITQLVPIRIAKTQSQGDGLTPASTSPVTHSSGGLFQSVTLSYEF